jgi:hypothetical protein
MIVGDNGCFFSLSIPTTMDHYNLVENIKRVILHAGLPDIRFHPFCHSIVSLMLCYRIPPIIATWWLCHSRVNKRLDTHGDLIAEIMSGADELNDLLITAVQIILLTAAQELNITQESLLFLSPSIQKEGDFSRNLSN